MGIPAFYRWLIGRFPLAAVDVIEETPNVVNGVRVPIDTIRPNPNGFEFDNLYLDMNGIVHPCFHPEDLPGPKTYDEVFKAVFKYIDRLFSIVRPRKLLYLAIDGVAPRAKMNQQRTRRFRAAKDAADEASGTERPRGIHESEGEKLATEKLDSNVITPGTEFMELLSSALRYYVNLKMNVDPGWQGIKVILSDASVPGEGEHKIMSYIRLQRNMPGFDPNTRHCLYGLDADLIMLALATHEIHFSILREDISTAKSNYKRVKKGKDSLLMNKCKEIADLTRMELCSENVDDFISRQKFQLLNIWVLRNYLAHDLRIPDPTVKADLESLVDDFVFMCLFVGNDFLPHVPSLEISEGAIDLLMFVYKKEFVRMGGYLTSSFEVNLERVEHFVQAVGSHENAIFRKRSQVQKRWKNPFRGSLTNARKDRATSFHGSSTESNLKEIQNSTINMSNNGNSVIDKVKLGEEGCRERYYNEKFEVKTDDDLERIQRQSVSKYIEGICWVMHYYYQGVCSWQWFYPYHYAPFASDFYGLNQLEMHFTLGKPFKPFDQLMGVLPAASAHALPLLYRKLMTDPSSLILDFYPSDFELDMNGKRLEWQAICKLPFIEESRLLSEIAKVEPTLTDEEKQRNSLGLDILFVHSSHPLAVKIFPFCEQNKDNPKLLNAKVKMIIDPKFSGGMNGYMYISDKTVSPAEIFSPVGDMEIITKNKVISVLYEYPSFHSHIPKPPEGVIMPQTSVSKKDLHPQPIPWHEKTAVMGHKFSERANPKSVWGPCLANLSHRLVSEYYLAKRQSTSDAVSENYINGEDRKRHLRSNSPKRQATMDGISENYRNGEDRMKKQSNDCDDPTDDKCDDPTDNKCDDPTDYKSLKKKKKKRNKRCRNNLVRRQATTDGVSENYINGEDKKRKRNNDCGDPTDNKCDYPTNNKCDDPKDYKIQKTRSGNNLVGRQATSDGVIENYINGENKKGKRSNEFHNPTDNKCDDPKDYKIQKKRKKRSRNNLVGRQATTDGVIENYINGEDEKRKQSNDCDDPTNNKCDDATGNIIEKKRKKRRRSEKRKIIVIYE